ncbi:MAG TPA: response regulator transcription factor [Pseudonocardiaceae bacterium]|nr:response regulator transcription factor [Pseudonocardiaceae bacterium]
MTIRVVLAEDNYLLRAGTSALLAAVDEVELVGLAEDLGGLLVQVDEQRPDVVITDIRMPPTHSTEGLQAASTIRRKYPGTGVILLSQFADTEYATELLRDGASGVGYLLKERIADIGELTRSLGQVAAGGSALDPQLVESLVQRRERRGDPRLAALNEREREVLAHMAQGKNNAAIGRALYLTERAVEKRINATFQKLGLNDSADVNRRVLAVLTFLDAEGSRTSDG